MDREPSRLRAITELSVALVVAFGGLIGGGLWLTASLSLPRLPPPPFDVVGWFLTAASLASLAYCAWFLSLQGRGTPYPRRPPTLLVTKGPYAHVRNPIILSWGGLLLGLALAFRLPGLLLLLVAAFAFVHAYIAYHEEPILVRRFGAAFEAYRRRVPRWIPRWRA